MKIAGHARIRRTASTVVLVAGLTVVGACSERGGDADQKVSRSEFASKVNALCEAEHKEVDALFAGFPEEPSPTDVKALIADFAPLIRDYRDGVVSAGTPEGFEDEYVRYVEKLDEVVDRYEEGGRDEDKAQALFNDEDQSLGRMEEELGLDVCASR